MRRIIIIAVAAALAGPATASAVSGTGTYISPWNLACGEQVTVQPGATGTYYVHRPAGTGVNITERNYYVNWTDDNQIAYGNARTLFGGGTAYDMVASGAGSNPLPAFTQVGVWLAPRFGPGDTRAAGTVDLRPANGQSFTHAIRVKRNNC